MKRLFIFAALVAAFFSTFAPFPVQAQKSQADSPAPAFTVKTVDRKIVRLSDFRGKVVLLDFGAVDCPPCRLEMPILEGWHKKYQRRGLVVLGLMEMNPKASEVKKMVRQRGLSYPIAIDPQEEIGKRYGLEAHPTTVLIDRSGKVIKAETGYVRGDEKAMEAALLPLLLPDVHGAVAAKATVQP